MGGDLGSEDMSDSPSWLVRRYRKSTTRVVYPFENQSAFRVFSSRRSSSCITRSVDRAGCRIVR